MAEYPVVLTSVADMDVGHPSGIGTTVVAIIVAIASAFMLHRLFVMEIGFRRISQFCGLRYRAGKSPIRINDSFHTK